MNKIYDIIDTMLKEAEKEKMLLDKQYFYGTIFIDVYLPKSQAIDAKISTLDEVKRRLNALRGEGVVD